jgi:hypothetical protein
MWNCWLWEEDYSADRVQEGVSEKLDGELRMRHIFRANELVELLRGEIA